MLMDIPRQPYLPPGTISTYTHERLRANSTYQSAVLSHKHAVHCRDEGERPVQETALKQDMHIELLSAFWNHWKREARQPNPPYLYAARRLHF